MDEAAMEVAVDKAVKWAERRYRDHVIETAGAVEVVVIPGKLSLVQPTKKTEPESPADDKKPLLKVNPKFEPAPGKYRVGHRYRNQDGSWVRDTYEVEAGSAAAASAKVKIQTGSRGTYTVAAI
jgi:hypothetical protein